MDNATVQGTLLALSVGALTTGITFVESHDLVTGIILVVIGAALIYWRELKKV